MTKITSTTRFGLSLAAALALLGACPPAAQGECAEDADCPEGEVCRQLMESEERVCIETFTPPDAGPDERDPVAIDELTADDEVVSAGGTTTLRWTARNATSCAFNEGIGGVDESGEVEVTVERTTEYTLSCQGEDGPALASVTVAVEVEVLSLAFDDDQVNVGEELTLRWTSIGATACTASAPGLAPLEVPAASLESGEVTFTATAGGEATLSCEGEPAAISETVSFEVARIASFTATPSTTAAGGTVTLSWVAESVTNCAVLDVTDADDSDSEVEVTVDETQDYTLRCEGFDGVDIEATVAVTVE